MGKVGKGEVCVAAGEWEGFGGESRSQVCVSKWIKRGEFAGGT